MNRTKYNHAQPRHPQNLSKIQGHDSLRTQTHMTHEYTWLATRSTNDITAWGT